MAGSITEVTDTNFQAEVIESETPVLVDFWAPWCGPCRALAPTIDKVADQFAGKVKVGKVNVDENGDLAAQYSINTIPRLMVFKGSDQPVQTVNGTMNEAAMTQMLNGVL